MSEAPLPPAAQLRFRAYFVPRPGQSPRDIPITARTRAEAVDHLYTLYPEALLHSLVLLADASFKHD